MAQGQVRVSWQVLPAELMEMLLDEDPAKAVRTTKAMYAMGKLDLAALRRPYDGA